MVVVVVGGLVDFVATSLVTQLSEKPTTIRTKKRSAKSQPLKDIGPSSRLENPRFVTIDQPLLSRP